MEEKITNYNNKQKRKIINKKNLKHFDKPRSTSFQNSSKDYWIYGKHSVFSALYNQNRVVYKLLITESIHKSLSDKEVSLVNNIKFEIVESSYISNQLNSVVVHQGIAALVAPLVEYNLDELISSIDDLKQNQDLKDASCSVDVLVILDQLTDPHNVGAIIRSAAAFGAKGLVVPKHSSSRENSTIIKSASGAFELIPIVEVVNIVSAIKILKESGYWVFGLDSDGSDSITDIDFQSYKKVVLVIGSEGKGIRPLVANSCDILFRIDMNRAANLESLNASNAAAIALHTIYSSSK